MLKIRDDVDLKELEYEPNYTCRNFERSDT